MTPKEKAESLIHKFQFSTWVISVDYLLDEVESIHCAIAHVDLLLEGDRIYLIGSRKYWEDVKKELATKLLNQL